VPYVVSAVNSIILEFANENFFFACLAVFLSSNICVKLSPSVLLATPGYKDMIDENIEREIELLIPPHRKKEFRDVLTIVPMMVQRDAFERLKKELVQKGRNRLRVHQLRDK
jgi:hypothetical protein